MKHWKYAIKDVLGDEIDLPDDAVIVGVLEDSDGAGGGETFIAYLVPENVLNKQGGKK